MRLKDAFYGEVEKPMKTVQKGIARRPPIAHKVAKKSVGRSPVDVRPRYKEKVVPTGSKRIG